MLDYAIVGGGIAGLYCARELAVAHPKAKISVFEKYRIFGGRVLTYRKGPIHWEAGAGRIHKSHRLFKQLLKEYHLTEVPIGHENFWRPTYGSEAQPNPFEQSFPTWLNQLKMLPDHILATHTIHELLEKIVENPRELTKPFPYWGEIFTLRADLSLKSFSAEMHGHEGFTVCPEGYDSLINAMVTDCKKRGVVLINHMELIEVMPNTLWFAIGPRKLKERRSIMEVNSKKMIFAMPQVALKAIRIFQSLPLLNCVKMEPLVRVYCIFPTAWFKDIGRFVTGTKLRYFIPVGEKTVMISYTDGDDTAPFINGDKDEINIGLALTDECRKMFPDRDIPNPTLTKVHPWDAGASYWIPGDYDPVAAQKQSLQPFGAANPSIHICGESFSLRQAWVEGALENTQELLRTL